MKLQSKLTRNKSQQRLVGNHNFTLTSPILSVERSFGTYGKHWKMQLSGGCNRAELWDPDN